jgi:hypothetical protein
MKEKWLMVCGGIKLDTCMASNYNEADEIFKNRSRYIDWSESDTISEADYINGPEEDLGSIADKEEESKYLQ